MLDTQLMIVLSIGPRGFRNEQRDRNRPRHDQLRGGGHGRRGAGRRRQPGRRADDARRWWASPRKATVWSARSRSGRPSPIPRTQCSPSSGSWAASTARSRTRAAACPISVVKADNGDAWVEVRGKRYSPPEISAMILQKLKDAARRLPRREGHGRRDHRAGVLQRRAASGRPRTPARSPA